MTESYYSDEKAERLADLPEIWAFDPDLTLMASQAWDALWKQNEKEQTLFLWNDMPCRMRTTDAGHRVMVPINADMLRCECDRAAVWFTYGKKGEKYNASPQPALMRFMLAMAEIRLPKLNRIVTAPVFYKHPNYNQICLQSEYGYNDKSKIYLDIKKEEKPFIIESPTDTMMNDARVMIEDLLADFPFASECDRVNAIGLMLLPFVRDIIKGSTPLHLIEAPIPGSGKNLLLDVLVPPGVGHNYKQIAEGKDDDEYRKRITSALVGKTGAIIIDNIAEAIASGPLASAITADIWTDRILGKSEDISLPVRTIWIATANNPTLSMEIARRTVRIRLAPRVDQPWMREGFRHANLREFVRDHRKQIVEACLTLIQSWVYCGCRLWSGKPLGSFENWSRVIGGILEHAGYAGFLGTQGELYDVADTDNESWRMFVEEWFRIHGGNAVGVSDLYRVASEVEGFEMRGKDEAGRRRSLGHMLKARRDRVYAGCKLTEARQLGKLKQWKLEQVMEEKSETPPPIQEPTECQEWHTDEELANSPDLDWAPDGYDDFA